MTGAQLRKAHRSQRNGSVDQPHCGLDGQPSTYRIPELWQLPVARKLEPPPLIRYWHTIWVGTIIICSLLVQPQIRRARRGPSGTLSRCRAHRLPSSCPRTWETDKGGEGETLPPGVQWRSKQWGAQDLPTQSAREGGLCPLPSCPRLWL